MLHAVLASRREKYTPYPAQCRSENSLCTERSHNHEFDTTRAGIEVYGARLNPSLFVVDRTLKPREGDGAAPDAASRIFPTEKECDEMLTAVLLHLSELNNVRQTLRIEMETRGPRVPREARAEFTAAGFGAQREFEDIRAAFISSVESTEQMCNMDIRLAYVRAVRMVVDKCIATQLLPPDSREVACAEFEALLSEIAAKPHGIATVHDAAERIREIFAAHQQRVVEEADALAEQNVTEK